MTARPRLASAVMLLRDLASGLPGLEVFMVRRIVQSKFMPDVYVFPGGSVTAGDRIVENTPDLCTLVSCSIADPERRTALGTGVRTAAIREMFEEANVLLAYHDRQILAINRQSVERYAAYRQAFNKCQGTLLELACREELVLATDQLVYCAHWVTPEGLPKRYNTHFFLATAPAEQEAMYDQLETSDGVWIEPIIALERFAAGSFPIAFPTYHLLRDLCTFSGVEEALQAATAHYIPTHQPRLKEINGMPHVYLPEDPEHAWNIQRA